MYSSLPVFQRIRGLRQNLLDAPKALLPVTLCICIGICSSLASGQMPADQPAPPANATQTEQISKFGTCGKKTVGKKTPTWGQFGAKQTLVSEKGDMLELECVLKAGATVPSFELTYTTVGGKTYRVGKCPFERGCNSGEFEHTGKSKNGKPNSFVSVIWFSRDYGDDDIDPGGGNPWTSALKPPPKELGYGGLGANVPDLDWAVTLFDVAKQTLKKIDFKFEYANQNPKIPPVPNNLYCSGPMTAEGTALFSLNPPPPMPIVVDPPLGPETEFFFDLVDQALQKIYPISGPMVERFLSLADLNSDGVLDEQDIALFYQALGSCMGDANYNIRADLQFDGCVDGKDEQIFFNIFNAGWPPPADANAEATQQAGSRKPFLSSIPNNRIGLASTSF